MENMQFVHLRLHSEYSIVDGLVRVDDAIAAAAKDEQPAMALTDLANVFGLIKFYKSARKKGVKPIAGCDVWITNDTDREKPSRLLLLVKDRQGYLNLCELLTRAWLKNQYKGRAEIRQEWLSELADRNSDMGLIALSGAQQGDVGMALAAGNTESAEKLAMRWAGIFRDSYYIEVQRTGQIGMEHYVYKAAELAEKLDLPVVATHPVQFLHQEDYRAHKARICIAEGQTLTNKDAGKLFTEQQFFQTQEQMKQLFADMPSALQNTVEIARRCNLVLELGNHKLPLFPTEGMTLDEFLTKEAKQGLEKRLAFLFPDEEERKARRPVYDERLNYEIETIIKMGFSGYFLIVAEFIQWAKDHDVPVGPGRGSGAGSLVAYCLLITNLDPIKYHLIFERFLNPERVSMPDFDVDFCQHKRGEVIEHVKEKYGADAVSQIATFGTMAAKAAVRDVGRVLDFGYNFCDGISKLIPQKPGKQISIKEAIKEEPILQERKDKEEEVHEILDLAEQVEGTIRNVGMHAGGVLIAPGKLTDFCPLYTQDGEEGVVSQFDKKDVEEIGLVKFDFLGLTTLTILDLTMKYIHGLDPSSASLTLETIPLDDRETFELLIKAKTVAVFQLESRGMQGMLKEARPDRFEDIIALVALYRPGPMDLIPDYCRRKHGEPFEYPDERTESILSETYGIMIYQEQVMQMAQIIGGYTLGGADLLRRAMGKKDQAEMDRHKAIFVEGAIKNHVDPKKAGDIFDLMAKFAGYGFNKSHATAYALLSYQTAYLKRHHPAAFMAANMSLAMDDTDKIKTFVEDSVDVCGLEILPPDINASEYNFIPVRDVSGDGNNPSRQIRYGLGAVKGSGESAIKAIVDARKEKGNFTDLFDFCVKVDRRQINKRTIESLIRAGAFDSLGEDRAVLLASVGLAIDAAEQAASSANQVSLFGEEEAVMNTVEYLRVPAWTEKQRLMEEKGVLGFYLTGHLFNAYAREAHWFAKKRIAELDKSREARWVAGIVTATRSQNSQRGKMMVVTIDDGTATMDVTVFSELLEAKHSLVREDEFLAVFGKVSEDRFSGGLRITADDLLDMTGARMHFGKYVSFDISDRSKLATLKNIMTTYRDSSGIPIIINYRNEENECRYELGEEWHLCPDEKCLVDLEKNFSQVSVVY